jgi:hypothetical protein
MGGRLIKDFFIQLAHSRMKEIISPQKKKITTVSSDDG